MRTSLGRLCFVVGNHIGQGQFLKVAEHETIPDPVDQQLNCRCHDGVDLVLVQLENGVAEDGQQDDESEAQPWPQQVLILGGGAQQKKNTVQETGHGHRELNDVVRLFDVCIPVVWKTKANEGEW